MERRVGTVFGFLGKDWLIIESTMCRSLVADASWVYDVLLCCDISKCGTKAFRLGVAGRKGLRVPDGFVVEPVIGLVPFNGSTVNEVTRRFDALRGSVAVRSSAPEEDGRQVSLAGQYDTRLRVTRERLVDAIIDVSENGQIPVLVQRMVDGPVGGVAFSRHPVTGKPQGLVEWSRQGAKAVTGNTDLVEGATADRLPDGSYRPVAGGEPFLNHVFVVLSEAKKVFGYEIDLEWMVDWEGLVWVLQVRPITQTAHRRKVNRETPVFADPMTLTGVPLSGGESSGPVVKLRPGRIPQGGIVVAHSLRLDQLPLLAKAAGLVVTDPSVLSHVAIRARELGIPAVGGVRGVATELKDGDPIRINGHTGTLRVESTTGLSNVQPPRHFFDPSEMDFLECNGVRFVVDTTDPVWIYSERPLQMEHRSKVRAVLDVLGLSREARFDERTAWLPGDNSPSIIYTQWSAWQQVSQHPQTRQYFQDAIVACREMDTVRMVSLADEIGTCAARSFQGSIDAVEQVENGMEEHAFTAVSHMATTRLMHGTLLGTVIVDVLAAKTINRNNKSDRLNRFVEAVSRIKNRHLVGYDTAGTPIIEYELVERMYDTPALMKHAVKYQW